MTSVPDGWPAPGCTTSPAGLLSIVLVQNFERQRFTGELRRRNVWNIDGDELPVPHCKVRPRVTAGDRDVSVRDELLYE